MQPIQLVAVPVDPPLAEPTRRLAGGVPAPEVERLAHAVTGISFVLPCHDEAENIEAAIHAATAAAARCALDHEIIVVDDGSSDATAAIAARMAAEDHHVRLVVHAHNRGYGDAVRSGMQAATMDWVFLTDADLQFDLDELEDFLPYADRADLIVGWRIQRQDPWNRRLNAAAWNWLVRRTFGLAVRDVDCAFKLMRRDLLQACDLRAGGAVISTELLVKLLGHGARLREIGVHHRPRVAGSSSGANPRVVLRAFRELATLHRALHAAGRTRIAA
jgi:glycosyltransferase involved in cell wall biosynthesis